jgi:hypothetical protein
VVVFVPERVGQALDWRTRRDHVAPGVQGAMDLGERDGLSGADQDPERREAQVPPAQRDRRGSGSTDRRGATHSGPPEASEGMPFPCWPEDLAESGELTAQLGHLLGDALVRVVERGPTLDEPLPPVEELAPSVGREWLRSRP